MRTRLGYVWGRVHCPIRDRTVSSGAWARPIAAALALLVALSLGVAGHLVIWAAAATSSISSGDDLRSSAAALATEPFTVTLSATLSTTQARAHPDLKLSITNGTSEHLKDITIGLPDGLVASLDAVPVTCPWPTPPAGCPASSRIGSVAVEAIVDASTIRLPGGVYMTDDPPGGPVDPAGLLIAVPVKVGGVDLGRVDVPVRVAVRNNGEAVDAFVVGVPRTVTGPDGGVTEFTLRRVDVDLRSDQQAPNRPLFTNAGDCTTPAAFTASFAGYDGGAVSSPDVPYQATGCAGLPFAPRLGLAFDNAVAAGVTGVVATLDLPRGSVGLKSVTARLPQSVAPNFPAFGTAPDMCPGTNSTIATFDASVCPPQAEVGVASVQTPLLPTPITGSVWLINKTPVPWLGIELVRPGVTVKLIGVLSLPQFDPLCDSGIDFCQSQIAATFANLPEVPFTNVVVDITKTNRAPLLDATLPGEILVVAGATDCVATDQTAMYTFISHDDPTPSSPTRTRVQTHSFTGGCAGTGAGVNAEPAVGVPDTEITAGPARLGGSRTSDSTPTFEFHSPNQPGSDFECRVDAGAWTACESPYTPAALGLGAHAFEVRATIGPDTDPFPASVVGGLIVDADASAPDTTIIGGPSGPTFDRTPAFTFSSTELVGAKFECRLDDGYYARCDSGSFTAPALVDGPHVFAVRATDDADNTDPSAASVAFSVGTPFNPGFTVSLSTTQARANPEFELTITSDATEDLKSFSLALPDGFFGSLNGARTICSTADAAAGSCPAGARVGEVTGLEARVDQSDIRLAGEVFLTDPFATGDPGGLSIKIRARVGAVDLGDVIAPVRLRLRGNAVGLDAIVEAIPRSITDRDGVVTEFNLRSITIRIGSSAGAPRPMLVDDSSCAGGRAFMADLAGYDGGLVSATQDHRSTGCDAVPFDSRFRATIDSGKAGRAARPGSHPRLIAAVAQEPLDAGIRQVDMLLPPIFTIQLSNVRLCAYADFLAHACPAATRTGAAAARTSLLRAPLAGDAYLVSNPGLNPLPILGIWLDGPVSVSLIAEITLVNGAEAAQIRAIFSDIPDVPLEGFRLILNGGPRSNGLLKLLPHACRYRERAMRGVATAHTGRGAAYVSRLRVACPIPRAERWVARATGFAPSAALAARRGSDSLAARGGERTGASITAATPRLVIYNRRGSARRPRLLKVRVALPRGLMLSLSRAAGRRALKLFVDGGRPRCCARVLRSRLAEARIQRGARHVRIELGGGVIALDPRARDALLGATRADGSIQLRLRVIWRDSARKRHSRTVPFELR